MRNENQKDVLSRLGRGLRISSESNGRLADRLVQDQKGLDKLLADIEASPAAQYPRFHREYESDNVSEQELQEPERWDGMS